MKDSGARMSDWTPKLNPTVDLRRLPLNAEEGFVLSRLDGHTREKDLPALTGFPPDKLRDILARLVSQGALLPGTEVASPVNTVRPPEAPAPFTDHPAPSLDASDTEPLPEAESSDGADDDDAGATDDVPETVQGDYRKLFETRLHALPEDQRVALAHGAEDPELSALCFDPVPAVIKAVLENSRVGLAHARLIARHHRNPVGLEALVARAAFAADTGVRRFLVRNPQLPAALFRRLWAMRRLMEHHKLTVDRDVPEQTRRTARELLRQRFSTGPSEEKVELILNTEGRALGALVGMPVDGKTTSLLCGRTYRSPMLVQNIARWSAAPPALIAHLLKQELVRRQPQLRMMLARHPNAPADAKRA
ncbi:hypothetical protein D7Y15_31760 [Corallococcus sp. AB030]|uniref:DUF2336 domain-containing protein n=2 Tax=Myxococcaceae TaxID=31 RepID=A0A7X4Y591_9BACT|nr:hypothetical protein [Corallococcus exiguus]RKI06065.1 hypothetical protein D7Y15_31760 [Corallococcus sp. AB030]RUO93022.1 hypothetical protein D7Y11_11810 [Corallococcus sp. AB018]TNV64192.1 hypothetical protein FH620_13110 [Corallococcus exiguus]